MKPSADLFCPSLHLSIYHSILLPTTAHYIIMSQARSLDRIQEEYIAEGMEEQEALIARENSNNSTIIRADVHKIHVVTTTEGATTAAVTDTTVTSTLSAETGTTTTTTPSTPATTYTVGETKTPTAPGKLPKTTDQDNINNDRASSYVKRNLCGSGNCCTIHRVCKDPLLYRQMVCNRLSNL